MPEIQKVTTDIRGFVQQSIDELESMKSFPATKKSAVITEMAAYFSYVEKQAVSRLRMGEHLSNARKITGDGTFKDIIGAFGLYPVKAYRLIGLYERLQKVLPPEGLVTAPEDIGGAEETRPFGIYQDIIDTSKLPKSKDLTVWKNFWNQTLERKGEIWAHAHRSRTKPTDLIQRVVYLELGRRMRQVKKQDRIDTFKTIVGMMMAELGITSETKFKPVAVPLDYKPKRGRPPKKAPKSGD